MGQPLLLASSSPYRRLLLDRLGLQYDCAAADIDESRLPGEPPEEMVRRLSLAKARAMANDYPGHLIIGSDQVASLGDGILTKPGNFDDACRQLSEQAGKSVLFLTGVALVNGATGTANVDIVRTEVWFRALTREEIASYVKRDEPYQCAGSFRSEGLGIALFERISSDDPTALIGLPLIRLCRMLEQQGLDILWP